MKYSVVWDEAKNRINRKKHGISFEEAVAVFEDPYLIELYDEEHSSTEEERYIGLGLLGGVIILYVVFTDMKGIIRLISARKAEAIEKELYYEQFKKDFI